MSDAFSVQALAAYCDGHGASTEDQQDPESSKQWQLARSRSLIEPNGGQIVEDFFDVGLSRSLPWKRRPRAAALLESFKDPGRGFDAVVVGEPARAFYGNQFGLTFPVFVHYGIQLWVPEVGGQVDPGSDAHDLVLALYGGMSKGERNRIKIRVRAAMAAQAAPSVRRIFAEFVDGRGVTAIANRLNAQAIPSRRLMTPVETVTVPDGPGSVAPCWRSSRTLGTPATRCGTSNARTRS